MSAIAAPEEWNEILKELRWEEDMRVENHFGDLVWLKPHVVDGERVGITECCFADDPCGHHLSLAGK